jgi:hypothetical protein
MINDIYNNQAVDIMASEPIPGNPAAMQPNGISPKAFTNQGAIDGMFGQANPGTFTRSVGVNPPAGVAQSIVPPYDLSNQPL